MIYFWIWQSMCFVLLPDLYVTWFEFDDCKLYCTFAGFDWAWCIVNEAGNVFVSMHAKSRMWHLYVWNNRYRIRAHTPIFRTFPSHSLSSTLIICGSNPLFQIFYSIIVFFCSLVIHSMLLLLLSIQIEFIGLFDTQNTDNVCSYTYSELDILFLFIQLIRNTVMD